MTNEDKITKVAGKLLKARAAFHSKQVTKTGKNEFAKYLYFELSDFLPQALTAFSEVGLVGVVSFTRDDATLMIVDTESGERLPITSPMSEATLRGCHPVQNLGAVQTYLRRYLWAAALELVEGDPVDSAPPAENSKEQVGPTPRAKLPVEAPKTPPRGVQRQETASGGLIPWRGHLLEVKPVPQTNAKGDYTVWFIKIQLADGEVKECATFSDEKGTEAQFWPPEDEIIVKVRASTRKPGKFEFMGLQQIADAPELELVENE
jgi:hypothetical protein